MHKGDIRLHASAAATPWLNPAITVVPCKWVCVLLLLCVLQYLGAFVSEEEAHQALQEHVHSELQAHLSSMQQHSVLL
jgi:hypothetical protein